VKILELIRLEETVGGTIGVLKIDKEVFCMTLEPPDRLNERDRSSIPAQQYRIKKHFSSRFGNTWLVDNVPGREHVLFHAGNRVNDTAGCILLGSEVGKLTGDQAVLNSGATFKRFLAELQHENEVHLTIREVY
jgi:hypothetical protein